MSSRKDAGRVDAESILHVDDQLLEEVHIPYLFVESDYGSRTIGRIRLVA
jgi:hypothetical protein